MENADEFEFPVLNESSKIIVLADEAHRTQYGTLGAAINVALPNAPRIAFTGTPLIKSQKTTNTFGSYIHNMRRFLPKFQLHESLPSFLNSHPVRKK